jgi:hypothetical protein
MQAYVKQQLFWLGRLREGVRHKGLGTKQTCDALRN